MQKAFTEDISPLAHEAQDRMFTLEWSGICTHVTAAAF
jgi:hypothetical protein